MLRVVGSGQLYDCPDQRTPFGRVAVRSTLESNNFHNFTNISLLIFQVKTQLRIGQLLPSFLQPAIRLARIITYDSIQIIEHTKLLLLHFTPLIIRLCCTSRIHCGEGGGTYCNSLLETEQKLPNRKTSKVSPPPPPLSPYGLLEELLWDDPWYVLYWGFTVTSTI